MAKTKNKPFPQILDLREVRASAVTKDGQTLLLDAPFNRILMAIHKSMSGEDRAMISFMMNDQTIGTVPASFTMESPKVVTGAPKKDTKLIGVYLASVLYEKQGIKITAARFGMRQTFGYSSDRAVRNAIDSGLERFKEHTNVKDVVEFFQVEPDSDNGIIGCFFNTKPEEIVRASKEFGKFTASGISYVQGDSAAHIGEMSVRFSNL